MPNPSRVPLVPLHPLLEALLCWQRTEEGKKPSDVATVHRTLLDVATVHRTLWTEALSYLSAHVQAPASESALREQLARFRKGALDLDAQTPFSIELARLEREGFGDRLAERLRQMFPEEMKTILAGLPAETPQRPAKGQPGRRGYPVEALEYAKELRQKNPSLKSQALRAKCLEKFSEDDLPPDADSFRRWLNRKRANRAN